MRNGRYSSDESYDDRLNPLYGYIRENWHKNKGDLISERFNLEECFTLLERQLNEAEKSNRPDALKELNTILYILTSFITEVLSDFQEWGFSHSNLMKQFGRVLYTEKANIITFNYDFFIEMALEYASGQKESSTRNHGLGHSNWNWNRALAYGINFDEVMEHDGEAFYSHTNNKQYSELCLLKLHGSLNWFRYLPLSPNAYMKKEDIEREYEKRKDHVVLTNFVHPFRAGLNPPHKNQLYIQPLIITPVSHKEIYLNEEEVYSRVFSILWEKAKAILSECDKLVIIGYSFPTTDDLAKNLFSKSFENNKLEELIIINRDPSVVCRIKDMPISISNYLR